ncbi:HD domain-containing protein [Verrucomicrobium spinosum]|nr:HD domain-containing protein [Verrucomicrobium spinosum]
MPLQAHANPVVGMAQFLYLDSTDSDVLKAASFANRHLDGFRRSDPDEPEADHAYRVANIVHNVLLLDAPEYSVVALLHDVLEKTPTDPGLVEAVFGTSVALAVQALTRQEEMPEADYITQVLQGSDVAVAVKVADLMDNLIARLHSPDLIHTIENAILFLEAMKRAPLPVNLRVARQMLANTILQVKP